MQFHRTGRNTKKAFRSSCYIYWIVSEARILSKKKEGWLPQQHLRSICPKTLCAAGTIISAVCVREQMCQSPTALGKRSQFFWWAHGTKSTCWRTMSSKKVPLPPEHQSYTASCTLQARNGQDIQCVHFFLQSYLTKSGSFCFTKIELFVVMRTRCHLTLYEKMIPCQQDLAVSQTAVAKLRYSFLTVRSSFLRSLSLGVLLLDRIPLYN